MIAELLARTAAETPDRPFLVSSATSWSYAECADQVGRMGALLRAEGIQRFACHTSDSPELVALLLAGATAGAEVCVFDRQADRVEVDQLASAFEFSIVFGDVPLALDRASSLPIGGILTRSREREPMPLGSAPVDTRVLILTTGTTGRPKGAVYEWRNLVAQARRRDAEVGARWLLAYHMNHFAGMQMLVHVLVNGATLIMPSTRDIADAITAIEELGVTRVSATPTFWRYALALLSRDPARALPLTHITLGAEPASDSLLAQLRGRFPTARVSQVFAATEIGSVYSVRDGKAGLPASILDRDPDAEVQFRIIDGELWIRSRYGMCGYFGAESGAIAGEWRATGDLVERKDDRILFVGRKTETINVGGVKVHPLPIEELAQRVAGVTLVHAYGRPNPVTGNIVALDLIAEEGADRSRIEAEVRKACADLSPHARPRLIRFVNEIELRNRKVVRRAP